MIDCFNRNINVLRISLTDSCNLKCFYCYEEEKSAPTIHKIDKNKIIEIVKTAAKMGLNQIKLTGGEPLLYKEIPEVVYDIRQVKEIDDISMTTNGVLLAEYAEILKKNGLDRVNVSLDTLDRDVYRQITGFDLIDKVFEGIDRAKKNNLTPIKINTVFLKGVNDNEIPEIKSFCKKNNLEFQLINRMILDQNKKDSESKNSDKPPDCSKCNRIRLTSDGKLLPCLFSEKFIDLTGYTDYSAALKDCINIKPERGEKKSAKQMFQIGG
ncbi:MAG TPA: radical SAM protein [Spirochaetota bacterium]|nr:radical SAM protein [Spirochaetota bacterium]HOS32067.1 radical SAM protein [Spirochaetota bacterium]HOS55408.1 radical SAM protein [Spirochaetota bacterium]HQF76856.1 radical SAM protein [Spirochaetota bacterium]HQH31480.1 radical SAM protein [Spirochaetota bacterium]